MTRRVAPFLDARLLPFRDAAWTEDGKPDVEHVAETAEIATGGGLSASALIASTAFVQAGRAMQERVMTGT